VAWWKEMFAFNRDYHRRNLKSQENASDAMTHDATLSTGDRPPENDPNPP
jgi:hypothetical protein